MIGAGENKSKTETTIDQNGDEFQASKKKHSLGRRKSSTDVWNRISRSFKKADDDIIDREELMNAEIDVEFCERLLSKPSSRNYASLNSFLKTCKSAWLREFLECNALGIMFSSLGFQGLRKNASFSDAVIQLELVQIIKTVLNHPVGMEFIIDDEDLVRQLALGRSGFCHDVFSQGIVKFKCFNFLRCTAQKH